MGTFRTRQFAANENLQKMSRHAKIRALQNEEQVLMKLAGKLNDQLNRLKVEELALQSQLRAQNHEKSMESTKEEDEEVEPSQQLINWQDALKQEDEQAKNAETELDLLAGL